MNRRNFVRTGVAGAASLGALSLTGCSQLPGIGASGGSYTKWLHEPGELGGGDHYSVSVFKPQQIISNEDVFDEDRVDNMEDNYDDTLDPTGVDADQVGQVINTNSSTIFTGGYPAQEVMEELDDNDFDDEEEVGGFTIYANDDERLAWSVSSNVLIQTWSAGGDTAVETAETVVEVGSGDESRYAEENEGMAILTSNLGNGFALFAYTYEESDTDNPEQANFEHSVGIGVRGKRNGDTVNVKYVVAYEDSDDVDTDDLEDWIDEQEDGTFDDVDDLSTNASGRAGVITGTMDADDVTLFG